MRAVVQRVSRARVIVENQTVGDIGNGLLVLLGVAVSDSEADADYLVEKICTLRIFEDADGKMNLDVSQTGGSILAVSQFTLYGDARRGRRPSFDDAARPEPARQLYEYFVEQIRTAQTALRDRPVSGLHAGRARQPGPGHHPARLAKTVLASALGRNSGRVYVTASTASAIATASTAGRTSCTRTI